MIADQPSSTALNTSVEQECLKESQCRQEESVRAEAETICNVVTEDITRFVKKFPPSPCDWGMMDNTIIESAMKNISGWEREMKNFRKKAREMETLVTENSPEVNIVKKKR